MSPDTIKDQQNDGAFVGAWYCTNTKHQQVGAKALYAKGCNTCLPT
ncbi:MAG: hypothetical protein NTV00_14935 [Methylococcales bacterium]|nr:hypothetical protein [Methylococcales bacterium]